MIKILLTFYFLINMIVEIGMGMKFFSEYMCSVGKKYLDIDTDLLLGLLLLMNLFRMSKKSIATRRTRQRSSILQHEIPHSGCWSDLTSTHKLPFALVFGGSTRLRVHSKCHLLKS